MTSGGIVTNEGRKIMLDRTYNLVPTRSQVDRFKIGIGTKTVELTDTDLETPIPFSGTESVDNCDTANWTDSADMTTTENTTTFKEGTGSLNLTKDAGTTATINTYKTTSSLDFTDKEFSMWLYIIDSPALAKLATSNCLEIRFGSDSSNYYYWRKDNADLIAGQWNLINGLTVATADGTTGSPVIGACDYTMVILEANASATTWSDGDIMMDDLKLISADDYIKTFETNYPAIDYTELQVVIRARVNTTEANGYGVSEVGIVNRDGTPLLESRDVHNVISKSTDDEIIYIIKTTLE